MSAELLERLGGFPKVMVHLDFETFYSADYTLRKQTTEAYVRDERFQVIGVGVRVGNAPSVWLEEWEFAEWAKRVDWSRCAVNANHAQFDGFILSQRYGISPAFWFDTMYLGRVLHGEGALAKLALRYGIGAKGDLIESNKFKGKRREDLTQREWREFGVYCCNDVDLSAQLLKLMGPGFPRLEFWIIDSTIRMFTEPVFRADLDALRKTLIDEREKKRALLQRIAETNGIAVPQDTEPLEAVRAVLSSSDKFAALLESMGETPPVKPGAKGPIFAFAKTDPGMAALLEHPRDDLRFLAEARLAVKSTIIETRTERLIGIAQRGSVPFYLKYCGAHTHRWSGGDKMNPQNFNRGGSLRAAILAPEGHSLVVVDSSQIEARVLPWLAGETRLLETFSRNDEIQRRHVAELARRVRALGFEPSEDELKALKKATVAAGFAEGDFYSDEGSTYFGKKVSKSETPIERQVSKNMILGLGFEMGWEKFAGELLKGMLGSEPVQFRQAEAEKFKVDVAAFAQRSAGFDRGTCAERVRVMIEHGGVRLPFDELLVHAAVAQHFVRLYRNKNARISALWKACEEVLQVMEEPDGDHEAVRMTFRGLQVKRHKIVKPSGLVLRYPGLRRTSHGFTYLGGKSGREMAHIYGGLLTENLVQSLARDIVAEQVLRVRADGYRLGTTTHDEGVAVVPDSQAEAALECSLRHFRTPPAWCSDLPLNAEGGIGKRYGDAK